MFPSRIGETWKWQASGFFERSHKGDDAKEGGARHDHDPAAAVFVFLDVCVRVRSRWRTGMNTCTRRFCGLFFPPPPFTKSFDKGGGEVKEELRGRWATRKKYTRRIRMRFTWSIMSNWSVDDELCWIPFQVRSCTCLSLNLLVSYTWVKYYLVLLVVWGFSLKYGWSLFSYSHPLERLWWSTGVGEQVPTSVLHST